MGFFDFLWGKKDEKPAPDGGAYAAPVVFPTNSDDESTDSTAPDSSGGFDGSGASGGDGGGGGGDGGGI